MEKNECSFQNIQHDMQGCLKVLRERAALSREEASAGRWPFDEILIFCVDEGIIGDYNGEMLRAAFMRRIEKEDRCDA